MVVRYKRFLFFAFILLGFSFGNPSSACCIIVAPPPPHNPVIIIPGFLGSFNPVALFKDGTGGVWGTVPFYDTYEGLIARFESAGYVRNHDLFIAYYDWRHPNEQSAQEFLAPIIAEAKQQTGQVDIVAHSMGGLLAQAYMKSDTYTPGEIGHLVMLGTPNKGSSDAYLPWEGGILPQDWGFMITNYVSWIEGALETVHDKPNLKNPEGYREFFPSLQELLPSGPFISKDGGDESGSDHDINPLIGLFVGKIADWVNDGVSITTIAGNNENTLGTILLNGDRTADDESLNRWRDGHPTEEVPSPNDSSGDSTVLTSSATLTGDGVNDPVILDGVKHIDLPEKAQDQVLTALGIDDSHPDQFLYQAPTSILGIAVLSPVSVEIIDPTGKVVSGTTNGYGDDAYIHISPDTGNDDPKLIILRNVPDGQYEVHLTGTGTGEYHVIISYGDDAGHTISKTLTGTTTPGKQESFAITVRDDGGDVSDIQSNSPSGSSGGGGGDHPRGDEGDCCTGHDPVGGTKKPHGKVLGISISHHVKPTLKDLGPLNETFTAVFGRDPNFAEWKYWADRFMNDKPDWNSLKGAMYWHLARGETMGTIE